MMNPKLKRIFKAAGIALLSMVAYLIMIAGVPSNAIAVLAVMFSPCVAIGWLATKDSTIAPTE